MSYIHVYTLPLCSGTLRRPDEAGCVRLQPDVIAETLLGGSMHAGKFPIVHAVVKQACCVVLRSTAARVGSSAASSCRLAPVLLFPVARAFFGSPPVQLPVLLLTRCTSPTLHRAGRSPRRQPLPSARLVFLARQPRPLPPFLGRVHIVACRLKCLLSSWGA